ncbi:MAG: nucleotidyltransferase family protein [Candidatus Hydrothermota bacterium]|nr:MAG: nucleotidyltransferase family protein [Candidatus Hydrothermae bacterium]
MKAVILAGGKGRRLEPYTAVLPKPLMPVGEYPILELILRQLRKSGVDEVILAVGHLAGLIQTYFSDGRDLGIKLTYHMEDVPLGTVGPLKAMEDMLDDPFFLVMNGDVMTDLDFRDVIEFHRKENSVLTIAVNRRDVFIDFGVVELLENRIVGYSEKPSLHYWVSMGVYVFSREALRFIPRGEKYDLPQLVWRLLEENQKVSAYRYEGFWLDIGREDDFRKAQEEFEKRRDSLL